MQFGRVDANEPEFFATQVQRVAVDHADDCRSCRVDGDKVPLFRHERCLDDVVRLRNPNCSGPGQKQREDKETEIAA